MFGAIILPNSPPDRETLPTTPPHTRAQAAFLKAAYPRRLLLSDSRRLTPSGTKVSSPPSSCPRATANDPFLVLTGLEVPSCHGHPPHLQPPLACSPLLQPSRLTFLTAPGHPRRLTRRRLPLGCGEALSRCSHAVSLARLDAPHLGNHLPLPLLCLSVSQDVLSLEAVDAGAGGSRYGPTHGRDLQPVAQRPPHACRNHQSAERPASLLPATSGLL